MAVNRTGWRAAGRSWPIFKKYLEFSIDTFLFSSTISCLARTHAAKHILSPQHLDNVTAMALSMAMGIGIGAAVGPMLFDDTAIGITFGVAIGAAVGSVIKRK
ncbi:hypothetical protein GFL39_13900 [Rhizobium leguminosarum bv. viciae]|uniref:Glycine zipper family protein n=1 Tax=Rhizobium laguerreae TaxID=1076926 RepID=A0A6N9ZC74_9HYPH|nr:hypothetical protein [Rhizobium laguerreae]NKK65639.1 hypothetical protein [Rhizobium leguminosarum bv. viciae]NKL06010.1 hypothetical protein [Rhizobium leguminosarum bv. viciae]NKL92421.1 hypothetical protein [Rhizobium leguminosarum bv. viciae]NKM92403.1 hypothetical protein [Rhizobium leguminosarum bv. viciae]